MHISKEIFPFILALTMMAITIGCNSNRVSSVIASSEKPSIIDWDTTETGLIFFIQEQGTGPIAAQGDKVLIHEITTKSDQTVVTDTWSMNFPIPVLVGGKQVIEGLEEAIIGMRVGERKRLIMPPHLSQRTSYPDIIDPNDTLYYDLILIQIIEE